MPAGRETQRHGEILYNVFMMQYVCLYWEYHPNNLFTYLPHHPAVALLTVHQPIYSPSSHPSTHPPSIHLLTLQPPIYSPSIHHLLALHPSIYSPSIHPSTHPPSTHLLSLHPPIYSPSIHPSTHPPSTHLLALHPPISSLSIHLLITYRKVIWSQVPVIIKLRVCVTHQKVVTDVPREGMMLMSCRFPVW